MFQMLSVPAEILKVQNTDTGGKKWDDASGFLLPGLSEGENMTNVRSDTAERWEQELLSPQEIRPC